MGKPVVCLECEAEASIIRMVLFIARPAHAKLRARNSTPVPVRNNTNINSAKVASAGQSLATQPAGSTELRLSFSSHDCLNARKPISTPAIEPPAM